MAEVLTEEAMVLVNRLAPELRLLVTDTASFHKIVSSAKGHYIYIQKSRRLGTINTSLPLPKDEPGTKPLERLNGSVTCHIVPEMEHLERFLRMLSADETPAFEQKKNRPFAVAKAPPARRPQPVVMPVPLSEIPAAAPAMPGPGGFVPDPEDPRPAALQARLALIHQQARKRRVERWLENGFDQEWAEKLADGRIDPDDAREHMEAKRRAEAPSDTVEGIAREAGIEIGGTE